MPAYIIARIAFYHSEEYAQAKQLRAGAAVGQFLAVDGYAAGNGVK